MAKEKRDRRCFVPVLEPTTANEASRIQFISVFLCIFFFEKAVFPPKYVFLTILYAQSQHKYGYKEL